jgi:hypothetical protein
MSVLKAEKASPSRVRGIYRYLLAAKNQKQKRDILEQILSPNQLVERLLKEEDIAKGKKAPHVMFNEVLNECIKCGLLIELDGEISINSNLPELARSIELGDKLLPDTLATLFFASDNSDEEDFGNVCAWFLAQDIYDFLGTWEVVEAMVTRQGVTTSIDLKMTSNPFFRKMDDWMCYMGLAWGHSLGKKKSKKERNNDSEAIKRVIVPDPTCYIKNNLQHLFHEREKKILIHEFIARLAKKCPLFETGKFREKIEKAIACRQKNYLSTSTAFALFRLQEEGFIKLIRESDADLILLPKANEQVDDDGRVSHIIWQGGKL